MQFATFFKLSTGYVAGSIPPRFDGERVPVEALGSDGVAIFDGRFGLNRCAAEARELCRRRGFIGFTVSRGESFTQSRIVRGYEAVK